MPKIPDCNHCQFFAHNPHLVCSIHPDGVKTDTCLDFRSACCTQEDPNAVGELWEPEGARYIDDELVIERSYYNGEEIIQPPQRWTREQKLWLLDNHPMFTGKCPACGYVFSRDYTSRIHFNCPECGWKDDSV